MKIAVYNNPAEPPHQSKACGCVDSRCQFDSDLIDAALSGWETLNACHPAFELQSRDAIFMSNSRFDLEPFQSFLQMHTVYKKVRLTRTR